MFLRKERSQGGAAKSIELISLRPAPYHGASMPRKSCPRLHTVTIKGKEFYQVSIPQAGGGRRLRTFKDGDQARRFFPAVQGEVSRLALYKLEQEARRYVHGEAPKRTKPKTISIH